VGQYGEDGSAVPGGPLADFALIDGGEFLAALYVLLDSGARPRARRASSSRYELPTS